MEINGLKEGSYSLYWIATERSEVFKVVKGEPWEKDNQIYKKEDNSISEIPRNKNQYMCLGKP